MKQVCSINFSLGNLLICVVSKYKYKDHYKEIRILLQIFFLPYCLTTNQTTVEIQFLPTSLSVSHTLVTLGYYCIG